MFWIFEERGSLSGTKQRIISTCRKYFFPAKFVWREHALRIVISVGNMAQHHYIQLEELEKRSLEIRSGNEMIEMHWKGF